MNTCSLSECSRPKKGLGYCDPHYQRFIKFGDPKADVPIKPRRPAPRPGHLWCMKCGKEKPVAEVTCGPSIAAKGWYVGECKACKRLRSPQSPVAGRRHWLQKAYGITPEQYDTLLESQGGLCAICRRPPRKNRLHVDHDHTCCPARESCGDCIRGLLCVSCNSKLEWWLRYKDAAAAYLLAYKPSDVPAGLEIA